MATGFEDYYVRAPSQETKDEPRSVVPGMGDYGPNLHELIGGPAGGFIADIMGFGDKKKKDRWVYNEQTGQWQYTGGGKAPVPGSDVPGAGAPSKTYMQAADQVKILEDLYPYYAKAIAGQIIPQEQAKLEAAKATSPQMADLMASLYETYGPRLSAAGNKVALQDALAAAEREKAVISGPGKELVQQALETAKLYDPEFFKTRATTSDKIQELLASMTTSGKLSESQRREVEQGLAREGAKAGTEYTPSATETAVRGMEYGEAGRKREMENKTAFSNAIMAASNFLPASKSGVDVFQVATGRSSANPASGYFTGVNKPGQEAYNLGQGLFGNIGQASNTQANISAQKDLAKKDWLDQFQQFTGGLANLGALAGGMSGF